MKLGTLPEQVPGKVSPCESFSLFVLTDLDGRIVYMTNCSDELKLWVRSWFRDTNEPLEIIGVKKAALDHAARSYAEKVKENRARYGAPSEVK